jgi:UDP-galactopyranose mutase
MSNAPALLVLSHLRWEFVFQRPQHLMTHLSEHYRVFFIEEPQHTDGRAHLEIRQIAPALTVCVPHTPIHAGGFHDDQLHALEMLLENLVQQERLEHPLVWLYTPMALPLAEKLAPRTMIYDCMDELSAFLNAPRQLLQRESALLRRADLVFTGGPSLFEAKRHRHPAVHCFPSSVDADHFGRAKASLSDHPLQAHLPHPRLGFYGVIDERLDIDLIAAVAKARPDWQLVLVGPVVKIDPATLPKLPNVHYLGQQSYADLPEFLAGWDVCLLPFALNDATRFISPTKTLEYMAADRPVVSTPIRDVVTPYSHIVRIAGDPVEFEHACDAALSSTPQERADLSALMAQTVAGTSWRGTAERMREFIDRVARDPLPSTSISYPNASAPTEREHASQSAEAHDVVIIGAGPTGLSAAYHLGQNSLLLEQNSAVGGWCRSIVDQGFTFDYAGHIMFSNDPYVHEMYEMLLGTNVHWQDREAWIYSKNVYTRYPFQGALYGLPPDVLKDCLVGAIEARFGKLNASPAPASSSRSRGSSASACKAESITDCCADGVVDSLPVAHTAGPGSGAPPMRAPPANFEQFIHEVWGDGVARHFALPYNRKLWAVPLTEMETSWLGGRVPMPDLEEMIAGALQPVPPPMGPNARFGYPLKGGFQALMDGFLPHLRGELRCDVRVERIDTARHQLTLSDGSLISYEQLISTMALPALIRTIGSEAPPEVHAAAAGLRHVSVRCVNLGIGRSDVTNKHWIYYPEDSVFHRIFVQGNASPHCNARGGFGLTCEITYSPDKPLPCEGEALIDRCIADCIRVGIIDAADAIVARNEIDMPYAYVIYDHARARNVEIIRNWLRERDIHLAGRYSEWEYYNSDHAFLAGRKVAEAVRAAAASSARTAANARPA